MRKTKGASKRLRAILWSAQATNLPTRRVTDPLRVGIFAGGIGDPAGFFAHKSSTTLNPRGALLTLLALGAAALASPATEAQARGGTPELQLYTGEMFGDHLTEAALSGTHPLLDEAVAFGGRYTYYFTDQWGLQLSAGYSPSRAARVVGGNGNLDLTTLDLDLVWDISPEFAIGGHTVIPYTEAGFGYAWADLGQRLYGVIGATPMVLTDSGGYTANLGIGVKYYLTSDLFIDFDARYRYLSRLLGPDGRGLNTGETTLSLAYRF
jgi:outer membrane protein